MLPIPQQKYRRAQSVKSQMNARLYAAKKKGSLAEAKEM